HSAGWRMRTSSKPGLADLRRLRQQAETAQAPLAAPALPTRRKVAQTGKTPPAKPEAAKPANADRGAEASGGPLAPEDKALFRQAVKSVQPLAPVNRALLAPTPVASNAILKQRRQ